MRDSLLFEGFVRGFQCCHILELYILSCQAVLTVSQLHHLIDGVPHCAIILHHHRLHRLDQTTLDVTYKWGNYYFFLKHLVLRLNFILHFSVRLHRLTSLSCLDSCINQTLSASHGVEEEFCWCQAGQVGVLHKTSALRTVVILDEVRQCAMFEAKRDSLTLHVLLPHHSNNLNKEERQVECLELQSNPITLMQGGNLALPVRC